MTTTRKNLTQPADWWAAFEKHAKAEGFTLSEWVGECCLAFLVGNEADSLSERTPAHRPKRDAGGV
jgi:hypothetical protein